MVPVSSKKVQDAILLERCLSPFLKASVDKPQVCDLGKCDAICTVTFPATTSPRSMLISHPTEDRRLS